MQNIHLKNRIRGKNIIQGLNMKKWTATLLTILYFSILPSTLSAEGYLFFSPKSIASHLQGYNEVEKSAIAKDLTAIREICLQHQESAAQKRPLYIATAGAPGARKSTILERFLASSPLFAEVCYIDPDQRGLKFMAHTYYSQSLSNRVTADYKEYTEARKAAYEKWRGASNYIALTLLEEAFSEKRDIAHGTTSTGGHIYTFLPKIKNAGYEIVLLLCYCKESFQREAIQHRNEVQKFYQSTPEDAINKSLLFPQRMAAYFQNADTLYLFWSDDLSSKERLAAIYDSGKMQVIDQEALDCFIQKFSSDRKYLQTEGKSIPSWNELTSVYYDRF